MLTIGFIGLGNMGQGMSKNIQKAGYPMVVFDTRREAEKDLIARGAKSAKTPAEVAKLCDIVFTSLPGPVEVEAVALGPNGLFEGIRSGSIYVDLSTDRPALVRKIASIFKEKGAHVLDAPVSGGVPGAASGNLAIMVGGDKDIFNKIKPVFDSFGNKVVYCGTIGAGSICKVAHNTASTVLTAALAEVLTLGVKAGVEPQALWDSMRKGALGRNSVLHQRIPESVFINKYEPPKFPLVLLTKDVRLCTEVGREAGVPMPLVTTTEQILTEALNRGWGNMDNPVFFKLQEEAAGVEVRIKLTEEDLKKAGNLVIFNPDANK